MIQRRTGWKCCGQMRPKSSSLASTQSTRRIWRRRNAARAQEHHPHRQTWRWKHYALGCFSAKGKGKLHHIKGQSGPGHWSQPGHWKWIMDGYSSMTMTQNTRPRQQRSGSRRSTLRSWSGLASYRKSVEEAEGSSCQSSVETFMTRRGSAKRNGEKSLLRCVQTCDQLQETSDLCDCQQGFGPKYQVMIWEGVKYL